MQPSSRSFPRGRTLAHWLALTFACSLAAAGARPALAADHAAHVRSPAATPTTTRQDTTSAATSQGSAADSLLIPPATGAGAGAAPLDTLAPAQPATLAQARSAIETPLSARLVGVLGMFVLLFLGWLLSVDRSAIPWRVVGWGIGLQLIFALFILKTPVGEAIFATVNDVVIALLGFTIEGARFLFGNLVWNNVPVGLGEAGANSPLTPAPQTVAQTGAFFAFNVLPTIIFFSSLMTLLYYFGVMQAVVKGFAWVMMRTMKTSGAETLSAAGNIFLGQTEAPLLIKPFVATMTMSELMVVMVGGFATVAGGVMAAYVGMLVFYFPDIAGHLLAASVMSAPAALVFAKLMVPEREEPVTRGTLKIAVEKPDVNAIDAAARGAGEGLMLALNVGAMLLAFIALVALLNALIGLVGDWTRLTDLLRGTGALAADQRLTLEMLLGWLLAPLAWLMGVEWADATTVGSLLGIKTALNEFVAYLQLSTLLGPDSTLSPRSVIIATYALCGFANFSSIAIQIGGIGGIAPERRGDLAKLGLRAMVGGTLAAFMTATIAGILI
jgi:concentrative nucleoside transporter, CNT family